MIARLLIYFLSLTSLIYSSSINDKVIKRINKLFPNTMKIEESKLGIEETEILFIESKLKQKFHSNKLHVWEVFTNNNKKYTAILDNVMGKSMPITFLIVFNESNNIHNISIIKYREPYGGEIRSTRWLKQFENLNYSSNYKIGSSIDGISGATISTNSISRGANKLALLLEVKDKGLSINSYE